MIRLISLVCALLFASLPTMAEDHLSEAVSKAEPKTTTAAEAEINSREMVLLKVGGDYLVESVDKEGKQFKIVFRATKETGEADTITLFSDHVHIGMEAGKSVRLSAEVMSKGDDVRTNVEAYQVLLYLPAPEGYLPVWLLSNNAKGFEKGHIKYLRMHAPQSDFMVF